MRDVASTKTERVAHERNVSTRKKIFSVPLLRCYFLD